MALQECVLGVGLPVDDPTDSARTAAGLDDAATRLAVLTRSVGRLLPVARWSGTACDAADRRLLEIALSLAAERSRLARAAEALNLFSHRVSAARHSADQARDLLATARRAQERADLADSAAATVRTANSWSGPRPDGDFFDPHAVTLLNAARRQAHAARETYDAAARDLANELATLSGRRIHRAGVSPRVLLDAAGFVPVVGDAVDAGNAAVYLAQHRWWDGVATGIAAIPGPPGWLAGLVHGAKSVEHAGDIAKVVDELPPEERATQVLSSLMVRGRRRETRLLHDDDAIERLYREQLTPLGVTRKIETPRGPVWRTSLPDGSAITFRRFSGSGGAAIDVSGLDAAAIKRIHVSDG